jgi:hypothetical protein
MAVEQDEDATNEKPEAILALEEVPDGDRCLIAGASGSV